MPVQTPAPVLGTPCPDFTLPTVDGARRVSRDDFAAAQLLLVVFTCNHCPYAQAVEQRVIDLAKSQPPGRLAVVAICANDAESYPDDAPAALARRAVEKAYPFPYLHDEDQRVATAFGAVCTPDFFLYGPRRTLAYRGRLDDSWKDAGKVTRKELQAAIDLVAAGKAPPVEQHPSLGCSIKWRPTA